MEDLIEWCIHDSEPTHWDFKIILTKNSIYDILNWSEKIIDCFYVKNELIKTDLIINLSANNTYSIDKAEVKRKWEKIIMNLSKELIDSLLESIELWEKYFVRKFWVFGSEIIVYVNESYYKELLKDDINLYNEIYSESNNWE